MRAGCLISLAMWAAVIAAYVLVTGCSVMPSMRYCDKISYERYGNKISFMAECTAPVGKSIVGL